jgi:hypothetical protein
MGPTDSGAGRQPAPSPRSQATTAIALFALTGAVANPRLVLLVDRRSSASIV